MKADETANASDDALLGRELGGFTLVAPLGAGAEGRVFLARQADLEREAVVKVSRAGDAERFVAEARLGARLSHPYVAHVYAFGVEPDGTVWLALERARGASLATLLDLEGPLAPTRAVALAEKLADALDAAHAVGVAHGDLKPANVLAGSRGGALIPRLLDFGLARMLGGGTAAPGPRGTPAYMAPELWRGEPPTAATDQYALGALVFELLAGRPPFTDDDPVDDPLDDPAILARAHAGAPPPSSGCGNEAVDRALARALAKHPEQRFPSATAFARALRAAVGQTGRDDVPRLDPYARDASLARAPRPIANAVARIDRAADARQLWDALGALGHTVVRYVAVVGLAGAGHTGGFERDRPLAARVRALRDGRPSADDWLELAVAAAAQAPPSLARLAGLVCDEAIAGSLASLLACAESAPDDEAVLREATARGVAAAAAVLGGLEPAYALCLAVARGGRLELWSGAQPPRDGGVADPQLADGAPVVVDATGRPAVRLSPWVELAQATPESPAELFWLDGADRGGARMVALPGAASRRSAAVWPALSAWLGEPSHPVASERESGPYRGLAAFDAEHAAHFVGREHEVDVALNRLGERPLLALIGPSGAGKSSLVRAGIVPRLPRGWRAAIARPGARPFAALAGALSAAGCGVTAAELEAEPRALETAVRRWAGVDVGVGVGVGVVVVDQLEELFTQAPAEERSRLIAALAAAAGGDPRVRVIVTVRDDFLARLDEYAEIRAALAAGLQLVATPDRDALVRILVEPARACGYAFDDPDLPEQMARAVEGRPAALALLSFTAAAMWRRRDRGFRRLVRADYAAMGGVAGALASHAESVYEALRPVERARARQLLTQLATAEGTRITLARADAYAAGDAVGERVVERLIAARLVAAIETESGGEALELAHEALLAAWPRLAAWRRRDRDAARLRDQLRSAGAQWEARGRPKGLLWRGDALAELTLRGAPEALALPAPAAAFARTSLAEARRRRRIRRVGAIGAFVALAAVAFAFAALRGRAEDSAARSRRRLLDSYVELGRRELLAGDHARALVYLGEAYARGASGPALGFMLARALGPIEALQRTLGDHGHRAETASFSPDGRRVLSAGWDGIARITDPATGAVAHELAHGDVVFDAQFSPDGTRVATASWDGTARIWDPATGAELHRLSGHGARAYRARFSPAGDRLVTAGADGVARVWRVSDGRALAALAGHGDRVRAVAWSPDGARVATGAADGSAFVWNLEADTRIPLIGHTALISDLAWTGDGRRVVSASHDRTARVWHAATGEPAAVLGPTPYAIDSVAVDPAGAQVAIAGDTSVSLWSIDGAPAGRWPAHAGVVTQVRFAAAGRWLVTAARDSTAAIWERDTGDRIAVFAGHAGTVNTIAIDPAAARAITAARDGAVKTWATAAQDRLVARATGPGRLAFDGDRLVAPAPGWGRVLASAPAADLVLRTAPGDAVEVRRAGVVTATLRGHRGRVEAAALAPDGARVATVGADGTARVWTLAAGEQVARLEHGEAVMAVAYAADGELATGAASGVIRRWRGAAPEGELRGHLGAVMSLAYGPAGRLLWSGGRDKTAVAWDRRRGAAVLRLAGHDNELRALAVSADGALVATTSLDGSVRIWDARTGAELWRREVFGVRLYQLAFDAAGDRLATLGADRVARVWRVDRETRPAARITRLARCLVPLRVEDGRIEPAPATACDPRP